MKLVRFGQFGHEKPGIVDAEGAIRDASPIVSDITPVTIAAGAIEKLKSAKVDALPKVANGVRLGAPIGAVRHFIGIGLNYADHAAETGAAIPKEPIVFSKAPNCIVGPNDDVIIPKNSEKTDWEVELAFVIGTGGMHISEANALAHVAGYMLCNDVSERAFQNERGGQWVKGKSAPSFGPLGPWLVTRDEIKDPQNLDLALDIDGEKTQRGSTRTMIFSVAKLIAHLSEFMMLDPGDVVTTGTPPGVGMGKKPPKFLRGGETMHLSVTGLGEQTQKVVRYKA
jgi:2-keto-4-pentenoate hydratase/2-oxohepta-3-ene-1,7-dioic acid hydratase in catechol pathway